MNLYDIVTPMTVDEAKATSQRLDATCWKGKHKEGTKVKGGVRVNNCVPNKDIAEAQTDYQKRRQREQDVDAGKPVAKQREPRMTDYQKRRAEQKRQEALGENSWSGPDNAWSSEHNNWTAEDAQIGPDSTSPVGGNVQEEQLSVGDPIKVTGPNEFKGKLGRIYEFSPSGRFVIVDLYKYGRHSMPLVHIAYDAKTAKTDPKDDWYDESVAEGVAEAGKKPVAEAEVPPGFTQGMSLGKFYLRHTPIANTWYDTELRKDGKWIGTAGLLLDNGQGLTKSKPKLQLLINHPDPKIRVVDYTVSNPNDPLLKQAIQAVTLMRQGQQGVAEDGEGTPEGLPHLTKELLTHIVQQVGTEGAHAIVKSLEWGDGAAEELLSLILKDLKQDISQEEINETIRKVGSQYRLYSGKGKNLGTFPSKAGAEKHEREVQYFKHANESTNYWTKLQQDRDQRQHAKAYSLLESLQDVIKDIK